MYRVTSAFFAALFLGALLPVLPAGFNPETGSPLFQYYSSDQYGAKPQNWAIAQDKRGVMYFGNTDGVLEFDGLSWRTIRLRNGLVARSLAVDDRGTVFVGGQGDFGLLRPDATGTMQFVSLLDKIPVQDRKFTDVWRILPSPSGIYFSAYARLFRFNPDGSVKVWRPATNFGRAVYVLNALFVKTKEQGLLKMVGNTLTPIPGGAIFSDIGVTDAVTFGESALLASPSRLFLLNRDGAVRRFPTGADAWFAANVLYTIRLLPTGQIAAGSQQGGLALLSPEGTVDRLLTRQSGLPDSYVASIFADTQGGVWLAQNNGLTRFNPALSRFGEAHGLGGDVQCVVRQEGWNYVGTSSGLFRMKPVPGMAPIFERVAGIETSVFALQPRGKDLLAATGSGVFQVTGTRATQIFVSRPASMWDVSLSARDPSAIYAIGQAGVFLLHREGNVWVKTGEFAPPAQEFRTVLEDADGQVWATTRDAVWRIDLRERPARAEKFGAAEGVPVVAGGWISACRLQGHITIATSKGLRRYSEDIKRFVPDLSLGSDFADGSRDVYSIAEEAGGDVWVTGEKYHGILLRRQNTFRWYPMPLQAAGIKEIYELSLDGDGTAWATGAKGVLYRWERPFAGDPNRNFNVLTRLVQINQKDTLYGGAGPFGKRSLPWRDDNLHFEFAAPFYEDPGAVEYQTQLAGSDRDWSPWSHQASRDYTHLSEREAYVFRVRARTPHGTENEESAASFGILPPWFRTWWAYSIYAVMLGFGVWGIVRWRTRQLEADKRQLEATVEERTVEIRHQRDEIQVQERKSHALLLNILPSQVADELKATGVVKPVGFDDVTVCFTDFVGFTLSSEKLSPGLLVDALNEYFTAFDEIIERYGLEKLKTIGDSYMFASGLPARRASHAVDAVLAALEMAQVVKRLAGKTGGTGWNIRIGLHSGPVVAGVVGIRKFAFDIWGNTVNFAARMESSGVPGRVNMSERTCRLTRGLIDCEFRGQVKIKEGRELPMFLALSPADNFAAQYAAEFGHAPYSVPANVEEKDRSLNALVK